MALTGAAPVGVIFALVFVLAGLAFKISAVPFHMWTPDVYEGAPTPVTAFFASAPKMAAMAVLVRVLLTAFPHISTEWRQIVTFISIASMALGAFAAIGQTNIKRLMAYSSIGHMGFALVGVAAGSVEGAQGVALYMAIYLVMTLGTFAGILSMRRRGHYVETIADLSGLSRTNPLMAFFLAAMMFSLAGIPPLAGFFAKFYVFAAAINAGLYRARGDRRAVEHGQRLSTICASSRSCISTSRRQPFDAPHGRAALCAGRRHGAARARRVRAGAADRRRARRREIAVLRRRIG